MYCSRRLDFLNNLQSYMVNRKNKKSWDHHVKYTSLDAWTAKEYGQEVYLSRLLFFPPLSSNPALPSVNSN